LHGIQAARSSLAALPPFSQYKPERRRKDKGHSGQGIMQIHCD